MKPALVVLLLALPSAAAAQEIFQDAKAQAHYDKGIAHYAAKEYADAAAELASCYFIEPRREVLFAWAQAKRLAGDCASAAPLYRKYLETDAPEKTKMIAARKLEECKQLLGNAAEAPDPTQPLPTPETQPTPVEKIELAPAPAPVEPEGPRWETRPKTFYLDVVGDALAGAGVAALGTGIAFFVISGSTRDSAEGAATQAEFEDELASAKTQRTVAIASVSVGAALVVGALLRWTVFPATEQVQVGSAARKGGGTVILGWTF